MRNEDKARAHLQSAMKYLGFGMTPGQKKRDHDGPDSYSANSLRGAKARGIGANYPIQTKRLKQNLEKEVKREELISFLKGGYKPGDSLKSLPGAAKKNGQRPVEV
jgi:hypothetical protein